jgi:hypothetical protein
MEDLIAKAGAFNLIADISSIDAVRSAFSPSPASSPP